MKLHIKENSIEIIGMLKDLPGSLGRTLTKKTMLAAAQEFRDEAKRRVVKPAKRGRRKGGERGKGQSTNPVGTWSTGRLAKAIKAKAFPIRDASRAVPGKRGSSTIGYFGAMYIDNVKIKGRNARKYAHLVEFGTAPHSVGSGSRSRKRGKQEVVQAGGLHPGAKRQEFIRPSFDAKHDAALAAMAKEVKSEMPKALKKHTDKAKARRKR